MSEILTISDALDKLAAAFGCTLEWTTDERYQITGVIDGYPVSVYISDINGWMQVTIGTSYMFEEIYQYGEDYTMLQGYHVHYCLRQALTAWGEKVMHDE